jgi:hypothetical protein
MRKGRSPRTFLGEIKPTSSDRIANFRRAPAFFMILIYAWALGTLGFALATPFLLFVMLTVLGRSDLKANLVVALVGMLAMWVLSGS